LACTVEAARFYETARAIERKYTLTTDPADLAKIISLFNKAREADPGCALAYLGLGDAYQLKFVYEGHPPDALKLMKDSYRRAYEIAPNRAETIVGVGWTHFIEGDNDQAYAYFRKAMATDPSSLHVLLETGAFLRSIGMLEQGADYFTKVVRAGGTTADVYLLRAWSYEHMGLYESALADFDKMIELEPLDYRTRCQRARVLILMRRYDAAAAELAVAETLSPGGSFAGLVKGLFAAAKGDRKSALTALDAVPSGTQETRHTYFRSRIYAALGMKNEAIGTIQIGIAKGFSDYYDYFYFFPFINNTRDYFYENLRGDPRFDEILRSEERKYADKLEKYTGL
jgi:tetratricopeptide (TPR) repeat protein